MSICTSNLGISWNSNYKPGGTAIIVLQNIASAIINKRADAHGLVRQTTISILGKNNKITSVFNMYRPENTSIE